MSISYNIYLLLVYPCPWHYASASSTFAVVVVVACVSCVPTRCLTTHRPILVVQSRARTVTYSICTKPFAVLLKLVHVTLPPCQSRFTINAQHRSKKASIGRTRVVVGIIVPSRLVLNYVVVLQVLLVGNENVQVKNAFENCKITTHTTYSHR